MPKTTQRITFSRAGESIDSLPRCSGVYRFFNAEEALLYIGKSVDIHSRVAQHINEGRKPGRHQRLMSQVAHIDCQLTAGEIGALLIENAAIKSEVPLFNRRQRQLRRLWTIQLKLSKAGFCNRLPLISHRLACAIPTPTDCSQTSTESPPRSRTSPEITRCACVSWVSIKVMGPVFSTS